MQEKGEDGNVPPAVEGAGGEVQLKGELEFYQGYVRLKAAVKNGTNSAIRACAFKLVFSEAAFRLDRVEPELRLEGREVALGDVEPTEKRTVAFYLDPQICTESYLEGVLTYRDSTGGLQTLMLPRKLAAVVCPVLYTDENVNTAMLERMSSEELERRDQKLFSIPRSLTLERAFEIGKSVVQCHDLRLVRERAGEGPVAAEARYFGRVRGRDDRMVVRVRVLAKERYLEFHVASSSTLLLTGMLAELKSALNRELGALKVKEGMPQVAGPRAAGAAGPAPRPGEGGGGLAGRAEAPLPAGGPAGGFGPAARCAALRLAGQHEEALALAVDFNRSHIGLALSHQELGLSLSAAGRYADAAGALRRAVELDPRAVQAWKGLGIALGRLGQYEEAFRCYDRASGRVPELTVPAPPPPEAGRLAEAFHAVMTGLSERGGGLVQVLTAPAFCFRSCLSILALLLTDCDMDGVVVTVSKPAEMYRKALASRVRARHPPHYVEVLASPAGQAGQLPSEGLTTLSAFEPHRIDSAVRAGLQRVAERYGGEDHFVLMDDLTAMEAFNGKEAVRRFASDFLGGLARLNIFCFVMLPEERALDLLGPLPSLRSERLKIKAEWLREMPTVQAGAAAPSSAGDQLRP